MYLRGVRAVGGGTNDLRTCMRRLHGASFQGTRATPKYMDAHGIGIVVPPGAEKAGSFSMGKTTRQKRPVAQLQGHKPPSETDGNRLGPGVNSKFPQQ
jgi:hypothetical protein